MAELAGGCTLCFLFRGRFLLLTSLWANVFIPTFIKGRAPFLTASCADFFCANFLNLLNYINAVLVFFFFFFLLHVVQDKFGWGGYSILQITAVLPVLL